MKLVMSMFDTEAIEDNEINDDDTIAAAWNSPSPSPRRAGPSNPVNYLTEAMRLTTVERAKAKAKALIDEAEALVARAQSDQLTEKDHFAIAEARRKAKPSSGAMYVLALLSTYYLCSFPSRNDPIFLDESDVECDTNQPLSFPEIPPLFHGIVSALKLLKILPHLK